jgi:hypothetical protein
MMVGRRPAAEARHLLVEAGIAGELKQPMIG